MLCSKRVRWGDLGGLLERGGYYKNQPLNGGGGGGRVVEREGL